MRRLAPFFLLLMLVSCSTRTSEITKTPVATRTETEDIGNLPTPTTSLSPSVTQPTEPPETNYWLVLGGDFREHRRGTGRGNNTDLMLLVITRMSSPPEVAVVQFPRNFYAPVESFPDMWMFNVYGREGFPGLHYYFQEVFNIPLSGIVYMNMDNFVKFVDDAFGVVPIRVSSDSSIPVVLMDGEAILKHLRDNENNWGCPEYDCDNRHTWVLRSLAIAFSTGITDDFYGVAENILYLWGDLYETDLSTIDQLAAVLSHASLFMKDRKEQGIFKFTKSGVIEYSDTPLDVRGWVIKEDADPATWLAELMEER